MTIELDCACGVRLRVPEAAEGKRVRCPKCKSELRAERSDPAARVAVRAATVDGGETVCPICQSTIESDATTIRCPSCEQVHHRECWAEIGGCSSYGCAQAPVLKKTAETPNGQAHWGDTKRCPVCQETIKAIALRCRYCHTDFDTSDPLTARDLHQQDKRAKEVSQDRGKVITIFVLSVIGLLAVPMLSFSLYWAIVRKDRLQRAGPLYQLLAWASVVLNGIYTLLFVVLLFFSGAD